MLNRRELLRAIPAASLAWAIAPAATQGADAKSAKATTKQAAQPLLASPPVIQHATASGFAVSFAVSERCTGWIEWGTSADRLDCKAFCSRAGLIESSDRALVVPVALGDAGGAGRRIFYRVAAQPLVFGDGSNLERGQPEFGSVRSVTLPDPSGPKARLAVVTDTHENRSTVSALAARVEALSPDMLVWTGDACSNVFSTSADVPRVLLSPGGKQENPSEGGWAATRPLLFVPGNHDRRGAAAKEVLDCLAAGREPGLPYNVAIRQGPLAIIALDTGEDKPDQHPALGGTADYAAYRIRQAGWLREAVARPEIASAPFKVAFCHIPLRGLPGEPDGTSLEGYAFWSGEGAKAWLPLLQEAGVQLIVSGHKHAWRVDDPTDALPMQIVGGGPEAAKAALIVLEADTTALSAEIQDLSGRVLAQRTIKRSAT